MDGVMLLRRAEEVGLRVKADGDRLHIRGPKSAALVVMMLAQHKCEVLRALSNISDAGIWLERYDVLTFRWSIGRPWSQARRLAWGELQNEWRSKHGTRSPTWRCAGCASPIAGFPALDLPDGNRVHLHPIGCLIRFGRAWRNAAGAGLALLGCASTNSTALDMLDGRQSRLMSLVETITNVVVG